MYRCVKIAQTSFLLRIIHRGQVYLTIAGNIVYLVLIYFLWKSIFAGTQGVLHGVTFEQTFLHLGCASSMFVLFRTYLEAFVSRDIMSGNIIMGLLRPVDYQFYHVARATGTMLFTLIFVALPVFIVLFILFGKHSSVSVSGAILFVPSIIVAFLLSTLIDYCIGCVSFFTESIWGISTAKESIVLFLSGAMIPLTFFPEAFQPVIKSLPFAAIYSHPLTILFSDSHNGTSVTLLLVQCFWLIILIMLSRTLFAHASKFVTVNGG